MTRVEGFAEGPDLTTAEEIYLLAGKHRVQPSADELDGLVELVEQSDIAVDDGSPHRLGSLRLDPVELRKARPSLVFVSISPFGQTGPYRDYRATNIVSFAMGGIMSLTGDYDREPLVSGGSQAQYLAGPARLRGRGHRLPRGGCSTAKATGSTSRRRSVRPGCSSCTGR